MAPNLNSEDYYEILGCSKTATDAELKKAYRKLAVKWHPDKNPGDDQATKNFQKVSEAFATLSDSKKRKLYDLYGVEGANASDNINETDIPVGGAGGGGFRPMGGGFAPSGGGVHHMSPEEAQQFFGSFFGGSDPFGGGFGGGGRSSFSFSTGGGGGGMGMGGGGGDPFSMMFSQGGGGMNMTQQQGSRSPQRRPSSPSRRSRKAVACDSIPPGTVVSLKGLMNAPDRNGDRGVIRQYMPQTQRYMVELEDTNETMSVKPSNLLQHVHVRIHDIQSESQQELNGKTGTILVWNSQKERYNIYVIALKKVVSLKPGNVVLETGTVAQITGLSSRPELNGKWGTIKDWVRENNRYDVQVSPQHTIRIKVENMRV